MTNNLSARLVGCENGYGMKKTLGMLHSAMGVLLHSGSHLIQQFRAYRKYKHLPCGTLDCLASKVNYYYVKEEYLNADMENNPLLKPQRLL